MKTNASNCGAKVRVGVDARCLNYVHLRGMGRYLREIITRCNAGGGIHWRLFGDRPDRTFHLEELPRVKKQIFKCRGCRFHTWEQFALPWSAARHRLDVLHCPSTGAPWWQPVPTVITVHDTLPWSAENKTPGRYVREVLPAAYRKCAAIITISNSSLRDIVDRWPELKPKIHVIPHGVDDSYLDASSAGISDELAARGVRPPYFLYLGGELERKRAEWAVDVLTALAEPRATLVLCGLTQTAKERVLKTARSEMRSRLVFLPFISDRDMVLLYQNAIALLYPTLYEGFGFPALEAQAVGTPALFSALGSLAELQGPGAIVMPPYDRDAWVQVCRKLFDERHENPHPQDEARRWARGFSWDVSARRHHDIYFHVVAAHKKQRIVGALSPATSRQAVVA